MSNAHPEAEPPRDPGLEWISKRIPDVDLRMRFIQHQPCILDQIVNDPKFREELDRDPNRLNQILKSLPPLEEAPLPAQASQSHAGTDLRQKWKKAIEEVERVVHEEEEQQREPLREKFDREVEAYRNKYFEKQKFQPKGEFHRAGIEAFAGRIDDGSGKISKDQVEAENQRLQNRKFSVVSEGFVSFIRNRAEYNQYLGNPEGDFTQLLNIAAQEVEEEAGGVRFLKGETEYSVRFKEELARLKESASPILTEALKEYQAQFEDIPGITLESREKFGLKKIVMTANISALVNIGFFQGNEGRELLLKLLEQDGVVDQTMYLVIPVADGETEIKALGSLPDLLREAIVMRTGWFSTPAVLTELEVCNDADEPTPESAYSLADVYDRVSFDKDGRRRIIVGVAGIGCVDEKGRGTKYKKDKADKYEFDMIHQLENARRVFDATGVIPYMGLGHSRAGLEALYFMQIFGVYAHAWNPAALPRDGIDGVGRVRAYMKALALANWEVFATLERNLANITLDVPGLGKTDLLSIIQKIVGVPPKTDGQAIINDHDEILVASVDTHTAPGFFSMVLMADGQRPADDKRYELKLYEEFLAATFNAGTADFFVQVKELFARMRDVYAEKMSKYGEDFGLQRSVYVNGKLIPGIQADQEEITRQSLYQKLFQWQLTASDDDGHYNFLNGNLRWSIAEEAFKRARRWTFDDHDFRLAAALWTAPVVLEVDFDETAQTVLTDDLWREDMLNTARIIRVSPERYEKVRYLTGSKISTWERFRKYHHPQVVERMDTTDIVGFIREKAQAKMAQKWFENIYDREEKETIPLEIQALRTVVDQAAVGYIWSLEGILNDPRSRGEYSGAEDYYQFCERMGEYSGKRVKLLARVPDREVRAGLKAGLRAIISYRNLTWNDKQVVSRRDEIDSFVDSLGRKDLERARNDGQNRIGDFMFKKFFASQLMERVDPEMVFDEYGKMDMVFRELVMKNIYPQMDYVNPAFGGVYADLCRQASRALAINPLFKALSSEDRDKLFLMLIDKVKQEIIIV